MQPATTPRRLTAALLSTCLAVGALALPLQTQGASKKSINQDTEAATPTHSKKKGVSKVTYQRSSSEETATERDRRLYRECRGLPNAGACLGYTRR